MVTFLFIVLLLLSAFLIMIVLLQRGRGGGLAGAFGSGGGSQSAFGTKTGDVFTTVTVIAFVLFMVLSIGLFSKIKWNSIPDDAPATDDKVKSVVLSNNSVKVVWLDKSTNLQGYHISRRSAGNGPVPDSAQLPDVSANQTEVQGEKLVHYFIDNNLTPGTTYAYTISGWNSAGMTPAVVVQVKTTGDAPPPPPFSMPAATTIAPATTSIEAPASNTKPATMPATMPAPMIAPTASAPATAPATAPRP